MIVDRKFASPFLILLLVLGFAGCASVKTVHSNSGDKTFSFIVTADMREFAGPEYQTSEYFLGAVEAIKSVGEGAFMVSPGDIDPPQYVEGTLKRILGENYPWYPVVGNHESETPEDMVWLREWGAGDIPNLVRRGPVNAVETSYSFDYGNTHFAVINQYFDGTSDTGTDGDVTDPMYEWLQTDLEENDKPVVFVVGHEPIVSIPDADNGRLRHKGDNLDAHPENSHRFQELLRKHDVTAYLCGHTHDYSAANINGIWQIDAGHSRGKGDTGAPSTFLKITVEGESSRVVVYRDDSNGGKYELAHTLSLD